jgi:HEAT repeat protein
MLSDPQMAHYARYALEPNPDESVDEALREAAGELSGSLRVGVINSIGVRGDAGAAEMLVPLLEDSDPAVAGAAATTLARLKTPAAVAALLEALPGPDEQRHLGAKACLIAADELLSDGEADRALAIYQELGKLEGPKFVRIAALQGSLRAKGPGDGLPMLVDLLEDDDQARFRVALAMAHAWGGDNVVAGLLDKLPDLPADRAALVIYTLGDLEASQALAAVIESAESGLDNVRVAAVRVLATLGDRSAVPVLLDIGVQAPGDLADAARESLAALAGEEIDQELEDRLAEAEGPLRLLLIGLVGQRAMESCVPALLEAVEDADPDVRAAAIEALGRTVGLDDLPVLIARMVEPKNEQLGAAAKEALRKACLRAADRDAVAERLLSAMQGASLTANSDLLDLLRVVGGADALAGVRQAAESGNDDLQNAATRVLGEWLDASAGPVLLDLAKSGPEKYRIRSLRGYIRIIRQFGDLPNQQRLEMAETAMATASRDDEKRLVLDTLTRVPTPQSMRMILRSLDDSALAESACKALVAISETIVDRNPRIVAEAMVKVVDRAESPELKSQAQVLLNRANSKL